MAVLHRRGQEQLAREYPDAAKRKAREQAEAERGAREWEQLTAEAEREMLAELEAAKAKAAIPEQERTRRRIAELERPLSERLIPRPPAPRGHAMAREAVLRRWRREEQEQRVERERKDGTLKRRQEWDQAQAAIADKLAADLRAESERHETANQRIRQGAEDAQQKLGDRP